MENLSNKLGLRFYVSDAHHKEKCHNGSCCGLPESWNYSRGQFTEALLIAKNNGIVKFSDIAKHLEYAKKFMWGKACGFNSTSSKVRAKRKNQTMFDYIRGIWNNPNSNNSPYKYFNGVLYPIGIDENKDIIYKYNI